MNGKFMTLCQPAHVSRLQAICNPKQTVEQDGGRIWLVSFPFPVTTLMSFIARFKVGAEILVRVI
jgi:hypothetical protein